MAIKPNPQSAKAVGDLLINLGGGVISDLGGFLASVYMRGISYINIPTTLLAMIDASIGGKNGVDLGNNKNMLGTFSVPEAVFIDPGFWHNRLPNDFHGYSKR